MHSPRLTKAKLPQFVIPTTPTTACVKAGSAVFDTDTGKRLAFFDPKTRAQALFIHPQLAQSAPASLVQSASLNTLTMAVEGLESVSGNPLSDALLMHSLRLLTEQLPLLACHPNDGALRGQLILAALMAGQGTDFAGGGIASVLSHSIGARCNLANGLAGAIVLPHTMRFNAPATAQRSQKIAVALRDISPSGDNGDSAVGLVEKLLDTLDITRRLRDLGVMQDSLTAIADDAMLDWFLQSNPRRVDDPGTISKLLQSAW
jgi:alcohol dehydrogenase class IV